MVKNSGKTASAGTYKPINAPELVTVEENAFGIPKTVVIRRRQVIVAIEDRWRIDDEWWRSREVSRLYYSIFLASGQRLVIYKDLVSGRWYRQSC